MTPRIAYFAHDLADPAIHRRARMLLAGGAVVTPIGFHRTRRPPETVADIPPVALGHTMDGRLAKRAASVLLAIVGLRRVAQQVFSADVIMARNLEMLAIAAQARRRYAPAARLVYECLDVHNLLVSSNVVGGLLRSFESTLWRDVDLLLTSSPAFVLNYFAARRFQAPVKLVENKLLILDNDRQPSPAVEQRSAGPPWRIGLFGMIRCRRSLDVLSSLARSMTGAVEVVIRGRPSAAVFPDFERAIADWPNLHYGGPFDNRTDLPQLYGDVHFTWAVDYYERDSNSAWLLPNRIYEGPSFGSVPIGLADVETGRWLTQHGIGVVLREPLLHQLVDFFRRLDSGAYLGLTRAVRALPRSTFVSGRAECRDLVDALCRHHRNSAPTWRCGELDTVATTGKANS
jgi:succinoglycan biosynthesis protein ExoL